MIDLLIISNSMIAAIIEYGEEFAEFNQSTRVGVLKDTRSFRIALKDENGFWIEGIRGVSVRSYKLVGGASLSPRETMIMQSVMQR